MLGQNGRNKASDEPQAPRVTLPGRAPYVSPFGFRHCLLGQFTGPLPFGRGGVCRGNTGSAVPSDKRVSFHEAADYAFLPFGAGPGPQAKNILESKKALKKNT